MKVSLQHRGVYRGNQDGSAVIVVIVLLGIMLIYIGANIKTLHALRAELKLIETRQVQRVQRADSNSTLSGSAATNAISGRPELPEPPDKSDRRTTQQ